MKKSILLLFAAFATLMASAQTKVEIDGIWYNLVSKAKQAEVTFKGDNSWDYEEYSGSITIPATVTYEGVDYSVTSIGDEAFYYCSSLTSITIPEGVTSIGSHAFEGCLGLTSITIPESVTSIGSWAFYDCSSLTAVHISSIEAWCKISFNGSMSNPLYYAHNLYLNGELVTELVIPEGVTSIGNYTFYNCTSLTAITIPEGVTSIGDGAFGCCRSLTDITIPESVTSIGEFAFSACSSLTAITLPEGVTSIGDGAFSFCSSLTAITLPEGVTSIGDETFLDCSSLTTITIPENSQLTSIGSSAFRNCSSLTAITLPEGMTSIGVNAFHECSSLTAINIPEGVTIFGDYTFYGCSSLERVTINCANIEDWFNGSSSIKEIVLSEGVTSIGSYAFRNCSSLTAIVLPKSLESIGSQAFANCSELLDVYCYAEEVPSAEADAFDGSYPEYATLHVPASALETYKTTSPWSSFGTIVELGAAITRITLDKASAILTEGEELTLEITTTPSNADRNLISWSSSNPSVATVDNTGKVTTVAPGTATITAMANDGSGVSATCEITVSPAKYALTVYIDGEVFVTDTLSRGTIITLPDEPTKEGYTFSGWSEVPETMPAHDVTINATFTPNKYLVTFKIGNEVVAADSLEYGAAIVAPEAPEKEGYTFNGWGEVAATVPASDLTYEGSYSINSYALTYVVDGDVVLTLPVAYGATIPSLKAPEKEGYTFSGWGEVPETMPAEDVTIEGTFTANKYLVTFKIGNEVIASDSLEYQSAIVAPEAPEKEGYTFSGWGEVADSVPAHDLTYEGSYSVNAYVLTYVVDGEIVKSDSIAYGTAITLLKEPTKEGYTFSEWSEVPETMPANDVTVSGSFTINKYLVTFKIGDEVIAANSLEYGATIVAPEAPEKEGYTFNGWGEVAATVPASDLTYEGSYSVNSYTLTYTVDGEIVKAESIAYGTAITALAEPTKEGYTFSGWSEVPETMPANDVTVSGSFTINKYLVTFKIGDEVIASDSLEYKSAIIAPEAPEKEGYTFNGWGVVADSVPAHDLTYEGSYSINFYTLTYMVDGDVVLTLSVAYGATIPSLKAPEKEGYTFSGWSEAPATMPAKDVTIEGTFTQLPSVYLTINQADNGCVKQHLVQGTSCTFVIEAAEGWKIHTVTFNGEDVTSQLTEEGTFTTPELQDDAVLNIAYEKIDDAISHAQASRIKVQGHQGIISISGITEGTDISLYTTDGTLVTRETAEDDTAHLTVPTGQVYIVKVADTVVKIGM